MMFSCKKCEALSDEVRAFRSQNQALIDRLTAIADVRAYTAVNFDKSEGNDSDYYGGGDDEFIEVDDNGHKVIFKEEKKS